MLPNVVTLDFFIDSCRCWTNQSGNLIQLRKDHILFNPFTKHPLALVDKMV